MTFFCSFSLPDAQNITLLPVVINVTYSHHKRVPVVSLFHYCLLLTEQNSALHSHLFSFFSYRNLTYNTRYSTYNTLLAVTYLQYTSQYSQYITYNNLLLLSVHVTLPTINPLQEIIYNTLLF